MRNLTASFMALAVCSLIVLLSSDSYASSYEIKRSPFRLIESDNIGYSIRNMFERYENFGFNTKNSLDSQEKDILRLNEETISDIQKNYNTANFLRATIETSVLLGLVSSYYWATKSSSDDFDYDISFDTLGKKFSGNAILFDDNSIKTNSFPGHPLSGAYYYLIARNHNLSRTESLLWSFGASAINEFFIEFTEVASISDLVVTPVAGFTIGEAMYEFGKYFRCSKDKDDLLYKMLAAVMDPIALVNSFIWSDVHDKYTKSDHCSFTSMQKDMSIFSGMSIGYHENTSNFDTDFMFGFHGKLYLIPQYGQEGDIERFFNKPILSEMGIEIGATDKEVDNIRFVAKTVWAPYYRQNIARDTAGKTTGWSFFVGLASAFEHIQYDTGEFEDWIGALHVFGPSMEFASFHRAGYVRLGLDVFGDFAMVRSYAFDEYKKNHRIDNIKSVLMEENYYYAYGAYVHPKIEVRYGPYRFSAEYKYAHYESFEGRDRRKPTNDFHLVDEQQEYSLGIGQLMHFFDATFFKNHEIWIEAEVRRIARSGFIADGKVAHSGENTWLLLRFRMML
jgi:hypothetical protein